ncbi:hypothetical protein K504DRAFT_87505 [Pleomassaria siparia CBS 279.74]|uniref:GDP/GTP exchange factor Sec2 N-terminal domain-containing protein n=1 Tax=Pleomassaria siparia CBS 279.74 TaxID=1314801 RepID=A0A6G1K0I7_9PLEO|nr:hypothetical protein K504DRAFT_87505 [Pleomassaria siparia CBS 279.74]
MAVVLAPPPAHTINTKQMPAVAHSCPKCGTDMMIEGEDEDAKKKIQELEAQVEMLKEKATAAGMFTGQPGLGHTILATQGVRETRIVLPNIMNAVDKCADFEDQLRGMSFLSNATGSFDPRRPSTDDVRPSTAGANSTTPKQSRFSFLTSVTGRRGSPAQQMPPIPSLIPDLELHEQLEKERLLRTKAEDRARKVDMEIEELSVQLFSQANEMVATERKARAKLEARVEQLEKKDKDKMARLERLEKAVSRIDRVKAMLAAPAQKKT